MRQSVVTGAGRPPRTEALAVCTALVLACLAIYGQTLRHDFVNFDDMLYVTDNPHVQAGLTPAGVAWAFVTDRAMYFHPLTWMSHMLDCSVYGMRAWGHHLTSLLLHAASSLLLFAALRRLTGTLWRSAAAAALFAVHPLHVESVAWIAERKDVLSALFWMAALFAYARHARRPGPAAYAGVAAAFVLGLMSKPMVVTLPFVLLLLDYWPLDRVDRTASPRVMARKLTRLAWEKAPLFLLAVLSGASTYLMQAQGNNLSFGAKVPFLARCANAAVVYVLYLLKTVWPSGLAVFYPHPIARPAWQVCGALVLLASITLFCLSRARRQPYLIVGWLWYLGTLVPVIELVQAGKFSHADRYTYLPSIGLFIMLAWGAHDLSKRWRAPLPLTAATAIAVLAALSVCATLQTAHWRNSETLFRHALAVGQESTHACNILGALELDRGNRSEARSLLTRAVNLDPENAHALYNLGRLAMDENHPGEAADLFRKALEADPKYVKALYNLSLLAMTQDRPDEAEALLKQAIALNPDYVEAYYNLGTLALSRKQHDRAADYFARVLELDPFNVKALNNRAVCLIYLGRCEEAVAPLKQALDINPRHVSALENLAGVLGQLGRKQEADACLARAAAIRQQQSGTIPKESNP